MNKILLFLLGAAVALCAQEKIYASFDVAPAKDAQLALKAVGIVKAVNVEIGSAVKRGDVLLELENESEKLAVKLAQNDLKTLEQKIAAGESALNSAQTSLNAVSKKYEAGLLGYVEFLSATAQSFSAGSALELSKSKFEIKKAEYLYERGGKIAENIEKTERK